MHNEVTKIPDLQKNMHLDFKVDKFIKMMDFLFFYFLFSTNPMKMNKTNNRLIFLTKPDK